MTANIVMREDEYAALMKDPIAKEYVIIGLEIGEIEVIDSNGKKVNVNTAEATA
ncbi:hypothetical protein [Methanoplanus limicola]|uniref:Uncharacterized protein n=1 Tax=Methanoplanus limicola DSM 2279 TaxID=937775 RepID=H1Z184_9EURY|nr:hypothetical protein [Methanoplanus limicola]EHQ35351.1 hypothetical protein Metlim_1241 [Methanoplanus limicola DSM 2279]